MKSRITFLVLPLFGLLTGCDERAIEFASKTQALLNERSKLLERKIAVEQRAYKELASVFFEAPRTRAAMALANEQSERSEMLAADYLEGRKPVSHWRADLNEFRKLISDSRAGALRAELNQTAEQLAALEALRIEQDQLVALQKLLAVLIKKSSLVDQLKALNEFAKDTSNNYDNLVCEEIKKRLADASTSAENKKALQDLQKEKGCQ